MIVITAKRGGSQSYERFCLAKLRQSFRMTDGAWQNISSLYNKKRARKQSSVLFLYDSKPAFLEVLPSDNLAFALLLLLACTACFACAFGG